ncbi:hypothetical protein AB0M58_14085 [Streptomyces bobili]|uniref:hypothetical protein n=1 Tax=Streptomyces bobili TaxID=67280 RepID=UPI00342526D7
MLTSPSIRCARCGCTDLEAHLIHGPDGGKDVDAFNCRGCGFGWKAWETPLFSTPDYATAYSCAPDLVDEELALLLAEDVRCSLTRSARRRLIWCTGWT